MSDQWKGYRSLPKHGYIHLTVNHSKTYKNKKTNACTNLIEGTWARIRRYMPVHGVREGYIEEYLAGFIFQKILHKTLEDLLQAIKDYTDDEYVRTIESLYDESESEDEDLNSDEDESKEESEEESLSFGAGDGEDASDFVPEKRTRKDFFQ
ncbi:putative ISXO2-like transposase domain [Monocercomonoides exilis]|uniref:putative ISXO2-like transposase domain n=1 Tax=Monocercomonoides exilis TaxID=2049356 RepID=UPI003559E098|nr:putative ISXO2-like transposase domain [Monocercomonoides exilis]|eukprot:MONOS_16079.1-p1 / transcript=MONOS_16079.1 / gene=MONOS_16079 / organism=Monocercomonoides_exilis_PA203 / gene_product=unspecified product / transcript_product=unspecified product / location=Mono_scaffold01495:63-518(+) / protein_length=151 / sequence_SO=supercontig / SO=protein_coding / is_pseudo=false